MGLTHTEGPAPFLIERRSGRNVDAPDGALSPDGWIVGCYLHGLFANDRLRATLLGNLAARKGTALAPPHVSPSKTEAYDRLANHVRAALDMDLIHELLRESTRRR